MASPVRLRVRWHILQAATHRPSFLTVSSFFVFAPPFTAGDIGTFVLPKGMKYLTLFECTGLTGKAKG